MLKDRPHLIDRRTVPGISPEYIDRKPEFAYYILYNAVKERVVWFVIKREPGEVKAGGGRVYEHGSGACRLK